MFLKDTDGDGKADVREVLFSGWGTRDTHAGPSNLQYGLDNWIYGMQGYTGFAATVGGETHRFRQGFFRFKPDGSKLEFLRSTNNNTWGLGFSEEGIVFGSTANGNPSVYLPIPNRYYEAVRGWSPSGAARRSPTATGSSRSPTRSGRSTSTAASPRPPGTPCTRPAPTRRNTGTAPPSSPSRPATWSATFVHPPRRQRASGRRNPFNLLASDDEWTAPIMAEVGPDGNVWVIDWYNFIVQHNPTPPGFKTGKGAAYETDLRDKTHGRIYRVVYDRTAKPDRRRSRWPDATPEKLVATLKNDNLFWRRHAQRLLVERGKQGRGAGPAARWCATPSVDAIGLNVGGDPRPVDDARARRPGRVERRRRRRCAVAALKHPSAGRPA